MGASQFRDTGIPFLEVPKNKDYIIVGSVRVYIGAPPFWETTLSTILCIPGPAVD